MALTIEEHYEEMYRTLYRAAGYLAFIFLLAVIAWMIWPASAAPVPFNETLAGGRNLGQLFTFTMNNITGTYASAEYHFTVYDYRMIGENYTYYSVNWARWFKRPADPGKKYLAVWVRGWLEGSPYHGFGPEQFPAWIGDKAIRPDRVLLEDIPLSSPGSYSIRSEEMNVISRIDPETGYELIEIGEQPAWDEVTSGRVPRYQPAVIWETAYAVARNERGRLTGERYGWKDQNEMGRMEPGRSNAFDGYLIFQVGKDVEPEDIRIAGNFWSFGLGIWHLTETEIDQESVERYVFAEAAVAELERVTGIRLPDGGGRTEA